MSRIKVSELYCADKSVLLRAINSDADKCDEMENTFSNNEADGFPREKMTAAEILREAENALEFYYTGSIADECADGNKQALKEKRQLVWFVRKWKKILSDRKAWKKAASVSAPESAPAVTESAVITETAEQQTETESAPEYDEYDECGFIDFTDEIEQIINPAPESAPVAAPAETVPAPVAVITVTESAVIERQAELTESALQRRCVSLNSALQRLQRLRDSRRKLKRGIDRSNQGQILLSAVACLRLSILTVSAALEQRRRLTDTYKQENTRFQGLVSSASADILQAKTYRTSGMFPRLEIDRNEERTASESLQRLQADSESVAGLVTLNCAADRICALLQSAELLVQEFCRLRSLVIEETKTGTQNQTQVMLCSILLASGHSDTWRNRKNNLNTVNGINGQCLQNIERFCENLSMRLPDRKLLKKLTASGNRILRSTVDRRSPKTGRVSLSLGQRLLSYLNSEAKGYNYWDTADRLGTFWHCRKETDSAVEFQWKRQCFDLNSQFNSTVPAEHRLIKFAETLRLLTGQGQDREKTSYSVIMRNSEKQALPTNETQRLRILLRLQKFSQQSTDSDADRLRQRLQAFQRLRAAAKSSVCWDAVSQAVLSAPEIVGSLSLTDPETQQTFTVSVCRCSVETGTDETQEYFLSGELSADAAELLHPVSAYGTHRTSVITYHCRQGQTKQTDSRTQFRNSANDTESAVSAVCSAAPVETATETDRHGIEVLLRRCVQNIALAIENRKRNYLKTATAAELKKRQRQEKAAVLLRLLRLSEVRFSDSLSAGNCQAGSQAFLTATLRLPADTQSISGSRLARLWKSAGYVQNNLFFNVISAAEQRQQRQQQRESAASLN